MNLYTRTLAILEQDDVSVDSERMESLHLKNSSLNKYLTFYYSLERQKQIFTQEVEIKVPEEGFDVTSLEIDLSSNENGQELVEKVLIRLDGDSLFNSHGAAVLISQDLDGKEILALYNKTTFQKDLCLINAFSKGKKIYAHYPVFPNY